MMRFPKLQLTLAITLLVITLGCFSPVPPESNLSSTTPETAFAASSKAAKSAYAFVDSICVCTHWSYYDTPYGQNYNAVKQKLISLGVRHVRDGGSNNDVIGKMKELGRLGIKTTFVMAPDHGVTANSSYWAANPAYTINDFVKNKVGTNAIDAVEVANEFDFNYSNFYWRKGDKTKLNDNPNSPLYWVSYIQSLTEDTYKALKSDRATARVKIIGPSLGRTYDYDTKSPLRNLSRYVDWGNFHPYPNNGNTFNNPFRYNTIEKYYWHANFPSVNIDKHPYGFDIFSPPFKGKPMAATETGYFTTKGKRGVSEKVHSKYIPRLFLEYFRLGIPRTCSYELVDEWNQPDNSEANYGLLRHNLSPKPAYTAVKNLIALLKDPSGANIIPKALNYNLSIEAPRNYERTEYVHDLLLQKRDGSFYLIIWHEISNGDISTIPVREINPPPMPTQVNLSTPIRSATIYTLDDKGNMSNKAASIKNNKISLNVTDKATIIKLVPRK